MEEILHQLRLVVYPIIYRVLCIPGGAGFLPSSVPHIQLVKSSVPLVDNTLPTWPLVLWNPMEMSLDGLKVVRSKSWLGEVPTPRSGLCLREGLRSYQCWWCWSRQGGKGGKGGKKGGLKGDYRRPGPPVPYQIDPQGMLSSRRPSFSITGVWSYRTTFTSAPSLASKAVWKKKRAGCRFACVRFEISDPRAVGGKNFPY